VQTEVVRLKRTMGGLSRDSKKAFESLRSLLEKNCSKLRELYRESTPPCLPYIGTYMTDLTFIGEMKTRLPNGFINYRKLQLQAASLESLLGRRGKILYRLKEVKDVRDFLGRNDFVFTTEEAAYAQSLALEPRDSGRK
jgi:son of sevenless-like protein